MFKWILYLNGFLVPCRSSLNIVYLLQIHQPFPYIRLVLCDNTETDGGSQRRGFEMWTVRGPRASCLCQKIIKIKVLRNGIYGILGPNLRVIMSHFLNFGGLSELPKSASLMMFCIFLLFVLKLAFLEVTIIIIFIAIILYKYL